MSSGKIIAFAILAVAATEVKSWTIDLPLARKLFFSHNHEENAIPVDNRRIYDNIEPNSYHNADDYHYNKYVNEYTDRDFDNRNYADAFKHEGYMENKVHDIVRKGSLYLDGLRRSLENYAEVLKNCSRMNFNQTRNSTDFNSRNSMDFNSQNRPPFNAQNSTDFNSRNSMNFNSRNFADFNSRNSTDFNYQNRPPFSMSSFNFTGPSDFQNTNFSMTDVPQFNFTNANFSELNPGWSNSDSMAMCAQATKRREHVRRLTDLALWATKRLEDNAYDAKYNKYYEQEENELLLKLSWFLDRLAHYTGFEPNVQEFVNRPTTQRPPTNLTGAFPLPFNDAPRDVVQQMMDCMTSNSSEPAPDRCRYPLPLPDWMQRAYESRDPRFANARPQDPSLSVLSPGSDSVPQSSSLELLVTSDTANLAPNPASTLTGVKSVRKRSIEENPLIKLMKYYGKHKVWINSNPLEVNDDKKYEGFEVPNQLPGKSVQKRSIFKKHVHLRIPEPLHALRDHLKKEAGIHYEKNKEHIKLLKGTLEKMRHTASLTVKHNLKKFDHIKKIHKRSIHYGRKYKPRLSEDPYQDISYYVKNQKGIEYNYDPAQAALVRLGLEQIFQTGNIEVVRRYGSNFNPADPNPFYSGVLRASVDV